ncbi:MAG: LPS assembly protein LptD [Betaproteobacteria bacterium]|nr:LPS assembly protein LptD [Betaproteobacteria bacterium]
MHASARLALVFAIGLSGTLRAAENLPPLRVDPALLGSGAVPAKPMRAAELPAAEAKPIPPPLHAQPLREEATVQPVVVVPAQPEKKSESPAPVAQEAKPPARPAPTAAESAEPRKAPAAVTARPAAPPSESPRPAVPAEPQPPVARQAPIAQPPQVEEQPALPPLYSAHADAGLVPALKPTGQISPLQIDRKAAYPTFITASRLDGRNDNEVVAQGDAELRKTNTSLTADRLTYWKVEDEMEAEGNVRYSKEAEFMSGPKLRMNLTDNTGYFEQPSYSVTRAAKERKPVYSPTLSASEQPVRKLPSFLPREQKQKPTIATIAGEVAGGGQNLTTASGNADRIEFQGESRMRLTNATYSTCTASDPDWYAKAAELNLDYDREVGEARDATVVFKDVPLFYTPWLSFSLNNKRKTGLLTPTFGTSSKSGIEFTQPFYWDIAPNMDMTISPRLMSKRGLQINTEYRYLNHDYQGRAHVEWLPNDRLTDSRRYGYSILHTHNNLGNGFSGLLNVNGVSDDTYFRDLSTRITQASQGNLLRQGVLTYGGGWWSATANVQTYQTLQDPDLPPVDKPYQRVPQLILTASRPEFLGGTAFAFNGEYVSFDHPTKDTGRRLMFYPQLSMPLLSPAWHLTPKIGLHATHYDIKRRTSTGPDTVARNLPIFSVDAGLAFEREFSWFGKSLAQTLEPRLFYLLIPQRTQDDIPVFDTGLTDFNFATIFSDNVYSGVDRIADANQITAALTSRLLDPQTGEEYVRGMVGQRYYLAQQHVTLPGEPARPGGASDFLAALSGRLMPNTYADVAWQYDPRARDTERFVVSGRWQPDFAKVLNASYRYTRDHSEIVGGSPGIRQVDFSGQWPLGRGWYGVGRFNYSILEKKIIETIGGLEYNGGCWVGRVVLQRYATSSGDTNTALFAQLELNDFSKIGSNPLELLARRIPGYGQINQPSANPAFGYD